MQEAVVIHITHIAHSGHGAILGARERSALGIVEVDERRCRLEPDLAWHAFGCRLHLLIQNMQIAHHHFTHRTAVGQPLSAVAGSKSHGFRCAVILMDDGPPPGNHLLLDLRRAGCGGMHGDLQRRQVVLGAHIHRQLQHAVEHGRHQLRVGHAVFFNQRQIGFRIEVLHDDDRAAIANRKRHCCLGRRVVQRRGRQIDHARAVLPQLVEKGKNRQFGSRWLGRQWPQHAFGATGCTGRIQH